MKDRRIESDKKGEKKGRETPLTDGLGIEAELQSVARGAGLALFGRVVGNALRYGSYLAIARLLGAEGFGLYALGLAVYQLMEVGASMGLPQGSVRYVSMYLRGGDVRKLKGVLQDGWRLALGMGFVFGLILVLAAPSLAWGVFHDPPLVDVLRVFALGLPFGAAAYVIAMATTGFHTTRHLVILRELFQPFAFLIGVIGLTYLSGVGLVGTVVAWSLAALLTFLLSLRVLKGIHPAMTERSIPSLPQRWTLLRFSWPLWLAGLSGFALLWTDTLLLGYFREADEVGIYRAAAQTALLLILPLTALNAIFSPKIAALYYGGEREKLARLFKATAYWSFSLTLPGFLLLLLAGREVLRLFGEEFVLGLGPLGVLAAAQLVNASTGSVGFALIMTGRSLPYLLGDLVLVGLNLLLNLLLIPRWGLLGAAVATGISLAGVNLVRLLQVYRLLGFHPYDRSYVKSAVAGGAAGLAVWGLRGWLPELHFLITLGITALAVVVVYLLVRTGVGWEPEDRSLVRAFRGRLRPR
jgi:O-antigen/teichoic acid export membrane protein